MKYYYERGMKIPRITKGFMALWFICGFFFCLFATLFAYVLYRIRFPKLPSVRKYAVHWTLYGFAAVILVRLILHFGFGIL